jgi:hypothetical protein
MNRTTVRRLVACGLAANLAFLALPATAEEGTVKAQVTVAGPTDACILVGTESLDFGTREFGDFSPSESYELQSCSDANQDYLVRGTNAASVETQASWVLSDANTAINQFMVDATTDPHDGPDIVHLSHGNKLLAEGVAPDSTHTAEHVLAMPDVGSDGAGETFEFEIIWTAVASAAD